MFQGLVSEKKTTVLAFLCRRTHHLPHISFPLKILGLASCWLLFPTFIFIRRSQDTLVPFKGNLFFDPVLKLIPHGQIFYILFTCNGIANMDITTSIAVAIILLCVISLDLSKTNVLFSVVLNRGTDGGEKMVQFLWLCPKRWARQKSPMSFFNSSLVSISVDRTGSFNKTFDGAYATKKIVLGEAH